MLTLNNKTENSHTEETERILKQKIAKPKDNESLLKQKTLKE